MELWLQLGLPRTSWTLRPTTLIPDLPREPPASICGLQVPFHFFPWATAQEPSEVPGPNSQAQVVWAGICPVRMEGAPEEGDNAWPSQTPDRWDYSLFYRWGHWGSEDVVSCQRPLSDEAEIHTQFPDWTPSSVYCITEQTVQATGPIPRSLALMEAHRATACPERKGTDSVSLPPDCNAILPCESQFLNSLGS